MKLEPGSCFEVYFKDGGYRIISEFEILFKVNETVDYMDTDQSEFTKDKDQQRIKFDINPKL